MVAIVSGGALGLQSGSRFVLGGDRGTVGNAALGRNGDQAYLNAANGNLVIQSRDEFLAANGIDTALLRTYNSQGIYTDRLGVFGDGDNGDNFRLGVYKRVAFVSGKVNTAGSIASRTEEDGSTATYTYDAARGCYVTTDGAGAHDTLTYTPANGSVPSSWTWRDGDSQASETYNTSGLITSATDVDGNTTTFTYAGRLMQSVTMASGDVLYLDYSDNNLVGLRTVSGGVTRSRTRYTYDSSKRLTSVEVDLSPDDNSKTDGNTYTTRYTYDGTSRRIATLTQSDGTVQSFTYVQVGTDFRVASMTDGLGRVTRLSYDVANGRTDMTDPLGFVTSFFYDAKNQLTQVLSPAVNGIRVRTSYAYDASGNVTSVTDGNGNAVTMTYDGNGNQLTQQDALGNVVARSYNSANHVVSESVRMGNGGALVTRYVYDSKNHLRFRINPAGDVVEYRYDAKGQRVAQIAYNGGTYNTSALAEGAAPGEAQMTAWAAAQDKTLSARSDFALRLPRPGERQHHLCRSGWRRQRRGRWRQHHQLCIRCLRPAAQDHQCRRHHQLRLRWPEPPAGQHRRAGPAIAGAVRRRAQPHRVDPGQRPGHHLHLRRRR